MNTLSFHLQEVLAKRRRFETAAQAVSRMILEKGVEEIVHAGKNTYDYKFFREGERHIVGWFEEINQIATFIKEAAEGGTAKELAIVLVGEPGNGKTFFVESLCSKYRQFLTLPGNERFTFEFTNLEALGGYGNIRVIQSQTFEDPMVLAMNLFGSRADSKKILAEMGFKSNEIDLFFERSYRPLGACTEYIWKEIGEHCDFDIEKMLSFVRVVPVPMAESLGTVTGKYSAKDKITSSAVDLLGEEDLSRMLNLADPNNPYRLNVKRGAIARVGGGGIHFSDEIFKNKKDLVQIYLNIIQPPAGGYRNIELDGFKWPIDALIIATSNNWEYSRFVSEQEESPIKDRCSICYVGHNTDYKLQQELTAYALGSSNKTTVMGEDMHIDPNLVYAASVGVILPRLPHHPKLTPIQMMKLEAGEVADEKSPKSLVEVKDQLNASPDVTKRWGQKGLGHRDLGRALQTLVGMSETNKGKCLFALDIFKAFERVILDYVTEKADRDKYMGDLKIARKLYREQVKTMIFNAYMDDPEAVRKGVMAYINMIVGADLEELGPDQRIPYKDPQTGKIKSLKLDKRYVDSVEQRLGLKNNEQKEAFRTTMRKIYGQKVSVDPDYNFMDQQDLVKAVTSVRLESDVAGAASLRGALANRTNEENQKLYNRMTETMFNKLGYCKTCAERTMEYYCEVEDEG